MRVVRHYCAPLAAGVHSRAMLDNWLLLLLLRPPIRTRLLQKANQGHGCVHVLSAPERATELKLDGTFASCEYVWGVAVAEAEANAETCGFCFCYCDPPCVLATCKCAIKLEFRCPFRGREHTDASMALVVFCNKQVPVNSGCDALQNSPTSALWWLDFATVAQRFGIRKGTDIELGVVKGALKDKQL